VWLLRAALVVLIAPLLTSCAAFAPLFLGTSTAASVSSASSASSVASFVPYSSLFGSLARRPGDEARIDAVPVPSAPDRNDFCAVAALESLTHYWGDPADWREIACEIAPPDTTARR